MIAVFRRVFLRIGDTLVCEKTHKELRKMETKDQPQKVSKPKRMYHAMIAHEDVDVHKGTRAHSHNVTALESRGIDCIRVANNMWYEADRDLSRPPDEGWEKAFQAKGKPLPRSWNCDNVLESSKSYVSQKPDDAKHGISAAAAMLELHRLGELSLAHHAWQTQALKPHTIIQHGVAQEGNAAGSAAHGESLFFVIARGLYAARVCPVRRVGKDLLALEFYRWSWLVVRNVQALGAGNTFPLHPPHVLCFAASCVRELIAAATPSSRGSKHGCGLACMGLVCRSGGCW